MIAPERPNARSATILPYRRRAPAPIAKVRSNSDASPPDAPPKIQNKPAFHSGAGNRAAATVTLHPASSLTSHLAPFEIP